MDKAFWENAVNTRTSCRSYEMQSVEPEKMEKLKAFMHNLTLPFEHKMETRFFQSEGKQLGNSLIKSPPDWMAFLSATDLMSICKTGFAGELGILYATGLGLNTCWYGHYILANLESVMPHLGEHKNDKMPSYGYGKGEVNGIRVICVSPLGYWDQKGIRFFDRLARGLNSYKRKPLAELMKDSQNLENLPAEIIYALEFGRKAPSGGNTQHWRFHVSNDNNEITVSKLEGFKHFKWEHCDLDLGVCAAHIWLGLECNGIKCEVIPSVESDTVVWRIQIK